MGNIVFGPPTVTTAMRAITETVGNIDKDKMINL